MVTHLVSSVRTAIRVSRFAQNAIAGGLCLILAAQACPLRAGIVRGHSMAPTLAPGSLFLYDQIYYQRHPVCAGVVVLIRQGGGVWVKRVFAVEGQSIWTLRERMSDGRLRRDLIDPGQVERFSQYAAHRRSRHRMDLQVARLRLPAGLLFLVGDGWWSEDSRTVGPLAAADVIGRVIQLPGQNLGSTPSHIVRSFQRAVSGAQGAARPGARGLGVPGPPEGHRFPLQHFFSFCP